MSTVTRIECPQCKASCISGENNCWQCRAPLVPSASRPTPPASDKQAPAAGPVFFVRNLSFFKKSKPDQQSASTAEPAPLIQYDPEHLASVPDPEPELESLPSEPTMAPEKRLRTTLTGEVIEEDVPSAVPAPDLSGSDTAGAAATIGNAQIEPPAVEEVMVLTFCKHCGYQNLEGVKECGQCGKQLDVIAVSDYKEIEALPRAWGFDVLGAIWVILGISAIFAGQFLVQTNAARPPSAADYLWTGVVAVAPGVLVFMRYHFCRMLFWTMTLGSILVWGVIGVVWILGHLHVTDKGQVVLTWLFALSCLSAVSFFLVRTNDAFDYDIGPWLGRE